jgi:hypothetical protein
MCAPPHVEFPDVLNCLLSIRLIKTRTSPSQYSGQENKMRCQKSSSLLKAGARVLSKSQPIVRNYGSVSSVSPQLTTPHSAVFETALAADTPRNTWTKEEIKEIYDTPLMKLAFAAVRNCQFFLESSVEFR